MCSWLLLLFLLSSISLHEHATVCLYILFLMDTWAVSRCQQLWKKAAVNIPVHVLWWHCLISVRQITRNGIVESKDRCACNFIRNYRNVFQSGKQFYIPISNAREFWLLQPCSHWYLPFFLTSVTALVV